eukprot:360102-Chlamydomonas_euryale.AAC.6
MSPLCLDAVPATRLAQHRLAHFVGTGWRTFQAHARGKQTRARKAQTRTRRDRLAQSRHAWCTLRGGRAGLSMGHGPVHAGTRWQHGLAQQTKESRSRGGEREGQRGEEG